MFKSKKQKNFSIIVFGIYLVLLIWLILFKFSININELGHIRNINLIPFQDSMVINGHLEIREIIYNVLVFVPLGVYISIFNQKWSFTKKIIPCFCLSFFFETAQFVFAIGASDITDLIGNTLGGIIGIVLYGLFVKIFKKKHITVINVLGAIIEFFAVLILGVLLISNM